MYNSWDNYAELRCEQIDSGVDITFCSLFLPWYKNRLNRLGVEKVLEIGAGTGHLAKELECFAEHYVAIEPSRGMIAVAKKVLENNNVKLVHSSIEAYESGEKFDTIISHMCLQSMDGLFEVMQRIKSLSSSTAKLFFSIPHPCFYNDYKGFFSIDEYEYLQERKKDVSFSITKDASHIIKNVPYRHRPISWYINLISMSGICVTGLHELLPDERVMRLYGEKWKNPRYLIIEAQNIHLHESLDSYRGN